MGWIKKEDVLEFIDSSRLLAAYSHFEARVIMDDLTAKIKALPEETWMDDFQLVTVPTIPRPGKIYTNGACVVMSHQDFENIQEDRREQRCRVREAREEAREIKDAFRTVKELLR